MTLYYPAGCMRRVLIERPAPKDAVNSWDYKPTITNFVAMGDYIFATIDNVSPTTLVQGCTNHAYLMPEVCVYACFALALFQTCDSAPLISLDRID